MLSLSTGEFKICNVKKLVVFGCFQLPDFGKAGKEHDLNCQIVVCIWFHNIEG
jgi:hypothetical protein